MDTSLLAPCTIYCGNCALYRKGKCLGCAEESKKAESVGKMFCDIYSCAKDKNLVACSIVGIIPAKNMIRGFSLKVSLNGLGRN